MTNEFNDLLKNDTWVQVFPSNQHIVICKWIYKLKYKTDGSITSHKAHLVAKGFYQQAEVYFDEIFSLDIKPTTVHAILSGALPFGWLMRHLDVKNAFLHRILDETNYLS